MSDQSVPLDSDVRKNNPQLFDLVTSYREKIEELIKRVGMPRGRMISFTAVANTTTGTKVIDVNNERRYLIFFNNSGADVFLHNKKQNANDVNRWVKIPSGGFWEPYFLSIDDWYVLGTVGSQEIFGYEGI